MLGLSVIPLCTQPSHHVLITPDSGLAWKCCHVPTKVVYSLHTSGSNSVNGISCRADTGMPNTVYCHSPCWQLLIHLVYIYTINKTCLLI